MPGEIPSASATKTRSQPPRTLYICTMEPREEHPQSLLLVDDDQIFRERLARAFRGRGFEVRTAGSCAEALELARVESPEMAVVDLKMPGGTGLELLGELKKLDPGTEVVVLTGYGSISTAVEATKGGATNYLPKPADADDILQAFVRGRRGSSGESAGAAGSGAAGSGGAGSGGSGSGGTGPGAGKDLRAPTLARAEWEHINRVLSDAGGNISEAARRLGIHRRSLQRKLQKFAPE